MRYVFQSVLKLIQLADYVYDILIITVIEG